MMLFSPLNEEKKHQLETQLNEQRERLHRVNQELQETLRHDLKIGRWLLDHPMELATLMMFGGVVLMQTLIVTRRKSLPKHS